MSLQEIRLHCLFPDVQCDFASSQESRLLFFYGNAGQDMGPKVEIAADFSEAETDFAQFADFPEVEVAGN